MLYFHLFVYIVVATTNSFKGVVYRDYKYTTRCMTYKDNNCNQANKIRTIIINISDVKALYLPRNSNGKRYIRGSTVFQTQRSGDLCRWDTALRTFYVGFKCKLCTLWAWIIYQVLNGQSLTMPMQLIRQ